MRWYVLREFAFVVFCRVSFPMYLKFCIFAPTNMSMGWSKDYSVLLPVALESSWHSSCCAFFASFVTWYCIRLFWFEARENGNCGHFFWHQFFDSFSTGQNVFGCYMLFQKNSRRYILPMVLSVKQGVYWNFVEIYLACVTLTPSACAFWLWYQMLGIKSFCSV